MSREGIAKKAYAEDLAWGFVANIAHSAWDAWSYARRGRSNNLERLVTNLLDPAEYTSAGSPQRIAAMKAVDSIGEALEAGKEIAAYIAAEAEERGKEHEKLNQAGLGGDGLPVQFSVWKYQGEEVRAMTFLQMGAMLTLAMGVDGGWPTATMPAAEFMDSAEFLRLEK